MCLFLLVLVMNVSQVEAGDVTAAADLQFDLVE